MERKRMMETAKRHSHWWWFDGHNNNPARSQWLHSTLSELDEKTEAMLRIIEEDADSFAQRAEMYYKKRPQLVGMVEDFYRAHRSLAEQFDHLRHDPGTRRTPPLAQSFALKKDQQEKEVLHLHKSYDVCFTKFAYDSEDSSEKSLSLLKPFEGRYSDLAYDSDESVDSEVDNPMLEVNREDVDLGSNEDLMHEIERLKEENLIQKKQLMEIDKTVEELKLKLSERYTEVMELKEETEKLRMENVEMYLQKVKEAEERETMEIILKKEKEQIIVENATLNKLLVQKHEELRGALKYVDEVKEKCGETKMLEEEVEALQMEIEEQREMIEEKDEGKREAIRQLSLAIEMLKGENRLLKKALVIESNKKWNPFDFHVLKGFGKLFNCSIMSSQPSVVPL